MGDHLGAAPGAPGGGDPPADRRAARARVRARRRAPRRLSRRPQRLLEVELLKGLPELKIDRLRAVAEAALARRLDADRLRGLDPDVALGELQELPDIGPFYSRFVLVRASGHADLAVEGEPRVLACAAHYYGLEAPPSPERFAELAEAWRPFRTWASVLPLFARGQNVVWWG